MVEEYSFELAMSCDFGGYVMPMIEADPENLSEVQKYNDALTEWFRVHILGCGDANPKVSSADFLLLPVAQQADMSAGDFDGSVDLFFSIMKRHDGLADGFSAGQKAEIKKRLELYRKGAVKQNSSEKTKPRPCPTACQLPMALATVGWHGRESCKAEVLLWPAQQGILASLEP
jgi:hypothetical protein